MIALFLPVPPSTNNLYVNVRRIGRVRSKRYVAWILAAGHILKSQYPGHMAGTVAVHIQVPEKTPGDIDNRLKAILDLLVEHSVIEDDRRVAKLTIERASVPDATVVVTKAGAVPIGDMAKVVMQRFKDAREIAG